jgi:Type IV secretion system pilin
MKSKLIIFFSLIVLFLPVSVFAAEFKALVGIPGIDNITGDGGLNDYINALYRLSISIAALLAVIKIVIAGAKYMLTDIVPAKEEAKKDIQGALIGLLIVIGAIIILNTINTDLTNVNFNLDNVVLDDAPVLTGNQQREAECVDGCTEYVCSADSAALRQLSGLPEGTSCRQSCYAAEGFYYQTEAGVVMCSVSSSDVTDALTGSGNAEITTIACTDLRNGPSVSDFSCRLARGECNTRGGTIVGDDTDVPSISCVIPTNQNASSSTSTSTPTPAQTTRTAPGITVDTSRVYLVNAPAVYSPDGSLLVPAEDNHAAVITFPDDLRVDGDQVDVIINGTATRIGCDLITPAVCT